MQNSKMISTIIKAYLEHNSNGMITGTEFDAQIQDTAQRMIANAELTLVVGTNNATDFVQCSAIGTSLNNNGAWCSHIQRVYEMRSIASDQYNVQLTMLIIKIMHGLFNSFTSEILKCEHKIRKEVNKYNNEVPIHITETSSMGDTAVNPGTARLVGIGFMGEELLTQCGVQFHRRYTKFSSSAPWDFTSLTLFRRIPSEGVHKVLQATNMSELVLLVTTSSPQLLSDFAVTLAEEMPHHKKVKRTYVYLDEDREDDGGSDEHGFSVEYGFIERSDSGSLGRKT